MPLQLFYCANMRLRYSLSYGTPYFANKFINALSAFLILCHQLPQCTHYVMHCMFNVSHVVPTALYFFSTIVPQQISRHILRNIFINEHLLQGQLQRNHAFFKN